MLNPDIIDLFFLFLLLSLLQLLLIISFRKHTFFSHRLKVKLKKKLLQIILGIGIIILYIMLFVKLIASHSLQLIPLISVNHPPTSSNYLMNSNEQKLYEELGYRETADLRNYYFLYLGKDTSQNTIHKVISDIRKSECKKLCIVNLYDNSQAYALDMQRLTITSNQVMDDWNNKNYVFVADHYLAYLGPLPTDFSYYPFKDWYYRSKTSK